MIIKPNHAFIGMPTMATIELFSGDHVSITYKKPNGEYEVFSVSAQHLVFMATHEQSNNTIISRPGGVSIVE